MKIGFLDRKSTAEKIIYGFVFVLFTLFALSYFAVNFINMSINKAVDDFNVGDVDPSAFLGGLK